MPTTRQVCVLLREGQVLVDDAGALPVRDEEGWLGSQPPVTDRAGLAG